MKGLDLSKMKKVSSDDKTTVFQHDNGHQVKIAHAALSPKLMAELKKIPMHGQKMSDGGEPNPAPTEDQDNAAPQSEPQPAAAPAPQEAAPPVDNSAPVDSGAPAQAPPPVQPAPPTIGQIASEPTSANDALAHFNSETQALRQDFGTGKITPKTYNDLFEDKSTLGKVGMIFGMLASGMGSGLAHQPNALLAMMDKQIDRDLDAQKQNKANQFSAVNLAEQHYRNEVQNHFTQQQGAQTEAQTALAKANAGILTTKSAKDALELAVEQKALGMANMLPPNTPAGQKARAASGMLSNAITQQQAIRNQQTAKQIETNGQQVQQQQSGKPYPGGYILSPDAQDKFRALQYDPTKTPQQKSDIESQYNQAIQAEKALKQIDDIYPKMSATTTGAGSVANAIEGTIGTVPFGIGKVLGQLPGEAIRDLGGQKEKMNQTYKTQLMGYIGSALAGTNVTPTEIEKMAEDYLPTESSSPQVQQARLKGLKDKIITLTKTGALDSAGMTRK